MSESDSRDKKFVTSLVQSESGEQREMESRGKKGGRKERIGSFALSPNPVHLSLSPLSERLKQLKEMPSPVSFWSSKYNLRRIMAKSQRQPSEERWINKHGILILNYPYV